ncbi:unnamed protein product [Bathycoccus prasinos]
MAPSPPSVLSVVCSFLSKKSRTTTTRANVFPAAFASFSSSSTRGQNDLGKHLHKESELAGEASQRAYLRDLEQIHLKKRKLEHEREENEANVKREMMREMLLKEKKRTSVREEKDLRKVLMALVGAAVSATCYAMHYG